jgi:hypothetical protein
VVAPISALSFFPSSQQRQVAPVFRLDDTACKGMAFYGLKGVLCRCAWRRAPRPGAAPDSLSLSLALRAAPAGHPVGNVDAYTSPSGTVERCMTLNVASNVRVVFPDGRTQAWDKKVAPVAPPCGR